MTRLRLVLGLAAVAAVLAAVPAFSAPTEEPFPKGALYGGGRIASGAFDGPFDQLVAIRVSKDRTQLNFHATLLVDCEGDFAHRVVRSYNVPLKPDGTFAGSSPYHGEGPGGSEDGSLSYQGKFNGVDPGVGTARLKFKIKFNSGETYDCDTGSFPWRVRDPASEPGTGARKKKAAYYGLRSTLSALGFRLGKTGKKVRNLWFEIGFAPSNCTDPTQVPEIQGLGTSVPIKIEDGKFKKAGTAHLFLNPGTPKIRWKIEAKFGKRRVTGTLGFTGEMHDSQGNVTSRCTSPKLPIRLERG